MGIIKATLKQECIWLSAARLKQDEKPWKMCYSYSGKFMPTLSLTQNSVIVWGEKKKIIYCSENSMWNLNILRLKDESNAVAHKAKPERRGAGRNHRPSVPSAWHWKAAPVKPHLFAGIIFPEGSQAQEFKEEQQSTPGTGRSSRTGRIMDVLCHWRGSETVKPNTATSKDVNTRTGEIIYELWGNTMI